MCRHFLRGECYFGADCAFPHSEAEISETVQVVLRSKPVAVEIGTKKERACYRIWATDEDEKLHPNLHMLTFPATSSPVFKN